MSHMIRGASRTQDYGGAGDGRWLRHRQQPGGDHRGGNTQSGDEYDQQAHVITHE